MTVNADPIDAHLFLLKHLVREYDAIGKHKLEIINDGNFETKAFLPKRKYNGAIKKE